MLSKKKLKKEEQKELESFISKKHLELNILSLAQLFKNITEFYIPVRLDNRGRVYCNSDYLNYKSSELAKALLLFSKNEKVNKTDLMAISFLKIFGANCFGLEKLSFQERINWVNENEVEILKFMDGYLISKAKKKYLFIAFCFEYLKYTNSLKNDNTYFMTNLPIQLDATCNGYQHLALLIGDTDLAKELNLSPSTFNDSPKDFYAYIALKLKEDFKLILNEMKKNPHHPEIKNLENYKRLNELDIDRNLIKSPIMVKPYNASIYQRTNYIKEKFTIINNDIKGLESTAIIPSIKDYNYETESEIEIEREKKIDSNKSNLDSILENIQCNPDETDLKFIYKNNPKLILYGFDFFILSKAIDKIIYTEYPKLKVFNLYLKEVATVCYNLNISIPWLLPHGLKISQYYMHIEAIRVKPFKLKTSSFILKITNKNKINKEKQIRALMPNFIHSLDATSLFKLVKLFFSFNNTNFYSVHDCFAVTCNNVDMLFDLLKAVYINIYLDNSYLRKFDEGVINNIKSHFGESVFDPKTRNIKIDNVEIQYPDINNVISGKILKTDIAKSKAGLN